MEVLLIEYNSDGTPHSVFSVHPRYPDAYEIWDFEYNKRMDTVYRRMVGGGSDSIYANGPYWAASGVVVRHLSENANKVRMKRRYHPATLMEKSVKVGEFAFCETCDEYMDSDNTCGHIAWCPECSQWSLLVGDNDLKCGHRAEWA